MELYKACKEGKFEQVKDLIKNGVDPAIFIMQL
jgi:hypothetical protein